MSRVGTEDAEAVSEIRVLQMPANAFCPTGTGGGVDPSCKAKFVGELVGKAEHEHSAKVEAEVAAAVGGRVVERVKGKQQAHDVEKRGHDIEVKSMLKGSKTAISVHDDALLRKVRRQQATGNTFHTVVVDERATYGGGEHAEKFSGHRLYYKRGSGRYALSQMHRVSSAAELRRLVAAPDSALPEKAQGSLTKDLKKLVASAEAAHASRLAKDRDRKARLRGES
jgi:hypothetical protein